MIWNAADLNSIIDWALVEHNQNGTHTSALVTSLKASGSDVTTGTSDLKIVTPKAVKDAADSLITLTDVTTNDVSTSKHGFAPKAPNDTTKFLRGDGTWSVPETGSNDGWVSYTTVTPTTGTLDSPSFPIVFSGVDLSTTLYPGMKVKITQSTVKYFIITKVAYSTDTTVTLYGGTDYSLVASGTTAISAFSYSTARVPAGFPMSPVKWTVEVNYASKQSQATPTQNSIYNMTNLNINVPIGLWWTEYAVSAFMIRGSNTLANVFTSLSTANNTFSDADFTLKTQSAAGTNVNGQVYIATLSSRRKIIDISAKATYYFNVKTDQSGNLTEIGVNLDGDSPSIVRAVCAYL